MSKRDHPHEQNILFVNILELIVGVLLTESFLRANDIFIPISKIFEYDNFVNAIGWMLSYFLVISGWIGYHKSISKRPHLGKKGVIRYGIDIIILFLTYYIIEISKPDSGGQFGEVFLWVIPVTFICYSFWDLLKYSEYKDQQDLRVDPWRMKITIYFGIFFYVMSCVYYFFNINYHIVNMEWWQNKTSIDIYFIFITGIAIGFYRYSKTRYTSTFKSI